MRLRRGQRNTAAPHTLIIGDADGEQSEQHGPWAGCGQGLEDKVQLGGQVDVTSLGAGQHGAEGRSRCVGRHCEVLKLK